MNVYLMRHPAREGEAGLCIGQTDVALSAEGLSSLPRLGQEAEKVKPTRIISSDLQRCRILAETIAGMRNLSVNINPEWRELHFGDWENRTWDEIRHADPKRLAAWMNHYVEVAPPDGESFRQLQERALGALHRLDRTAHETIVVATHCGVIRALISAFSDVSLTRVFEISVPYGSLTHLCWRDEKWALGSTVERTDNSVQREVQ